jgi:hypothetical protein
MFSQFSACEVSCRAKGLSAPHLLLPDFSPKIHRIVFLVPPLSLKSPNRQKKLKEIKRIFKVEKKDVQIERLCLFFLRLRITL